MLLEGGPTVASYNRSVRISAVLLLILSLAGCAKKSNDAVRQGVIDYLTQKGINVPGMDISITNLEMNGSQADAMVAMSVKGSSGPPMMSKKYHLQEQGSKWVVVSSQDTGSSPHGAGAMPPAAAPENPHGAGAPAAAGKMPSPEDLPPAKKQ